MTPAKRIPRMVRYLNEQRPTSTMPVTGEGRGSFERVPPTLPRGASSAVLHGSRVLGLLHAKNTDAVCSQPTPEGTRAT